MEIKLAETDAEIMACFDVLKELRPHLVRENFLSTIRRLESAQQFKLVYLRTTSVQVVAGIRMAEWLHAGKYLEIEDLITTHTARSSGLGSALFDWLLIYAKSQNCRQLRLVSGVAREAAHRFYLRKGMQFEAKYFSINLT